jgi:hypothetical protein
MFKFCCSILYQEFRLNFSRTPRLLKISNCMDDIKTQFNRLFNKK